MGMSNQEPKAAPVAVYQDVESGIGLALLSVVAAAWLVGSRALGVDVGELDVMAGVVLGIALLFVLFGARRIEVGPEGIRVFRRGRLRLSRPLSDFARLRPLLFGFQCIVFRDGEWVWLVALGPGMRIIDFLSTLPESPSRRRRVSSRGAVLELPIATLRFPEGQCIGCRRPAETVLELEARRGFSLLMVSWFLTRELAAPGCRACKRRRTVLGRVAWAVPILSIIYGLFGPHLVPVGETDPIRSACFGIAVVGALFLSNWGARFLDQAAFGVSALSLSADCAHVRLRVRDVALRQALEEGAAKGEPRIEDSPDVSFV